MFRRHSFPYWGNGVSPSPAKILPLSSVDSPYQCCNFWSCTIFIFNFILFVHTGLTNFDFYWHSVNIYKMLCLASKKIRIVKITSPQISTTRLEFSHPSMLFGKPKTKCHLFKKCAPKNKLMPQCLEQAVNLLVFYLKLGLPSVCEYELAPILILKPILLVGT